MSPSHKDDSRRMAKELREKARDLVRRSRAEARARRRKTREGERRHHEHTLQVRVPADLFAAVAGSAGRHGRTLSDEVRACLEEHYDIVPPLPAIIGWQPFTLAAPAGCEGCHAVHHLGDSMFVAITRDNRDRLLLCAACKARAEARPQPVEQTDGKK
jgi:hypothetical protein